MGKHIGIDFFDKHSEELLEFIHEALQHGYGNEDIVGDVTSNDVSSITYNRGDWGYSDVFYGGEPFAGITTILYRGICCWNMVYYGKVLSHVDDKQSIYDCLRPALLATPIKYPFRGPSNFIAENGLQYTNTWHGNIAQFHGHEIIKNPNDEGYLFETHYRGGLVNLR